MNRFCGSIQNDWRDERNVYSWIELNVPVPYSTALATGLIPRERTSSSNVNVYSTLNAM